MKIRLPRRFFDDHRSRDLPTPVVLSSNESHVWISTTDPAIEELLSDAKHYASEARYFDPPMPGLASSAWRTALLLTSVVAERRRHRVPGCPSCDEWGTGMGPSHDASHRCESGKHSHCTCSTCF